MPEPIENLRQIRIEKLKKIRELGINPYPSKFEGRIPILKVRDQKLGTEVKTAGRLMSWRSHGKITFADLRDESGQIQLCFHASQLPVTSYQLLEFLDIGDFIGVSGPLFETQAEELSIDVGDFVLLSKSLRPLPEKREGLKDVEVRYRQRYLDLLVNQEVRKRFDIRTKLVSGIRKYLDEQGYFEVETPTLQLLYGGANARPFVTHHNALDVDFYLRIADELYLKRLIVGGYEKVYEICKDFRNEGIDQLHNPEFTMIELYEAYAAYHRIMDLTEGLFKYLAVEIFGEPLMEVHNKKIDIGEKWPRIEMVQIIKDQLKIDVLEMNKKDLVAFAKEKNLEIIDGESSGQLIFNIFEHLVAPKLIDPVWIIDYPQAVSPLSKSHPEKEGFVERFEGYVGGEEVCDGWSEINDPLDQRQRFERDQMLARRAEDKEEAHPIDEDFIKALEYGMPPLGGIGIGIDRLAMFFTNTWAIKELIIFPTLRPEKVVTESEAVGKSTTSDFRLEESEIILKIDAAVKKKFPEMKVGVVVIKGVKVKKKDKELERFKKEVLAKLKGLTIEDIGRVKSVQTYRRLFKATSVDWHSHRPSVEALLRRVVSGRSLYQVNNVVDAYNLAVLESKLSLGAFDLDKVVLPKVLRFAKDGEKIVLLGESEPTVIHEGELIYADCEGPLTLDLNYRDCDRTKVTQKTKNVLLVADGGKGISRKAIEEALELGSNFITHFAGGEIVVKKIVE